MDLPLDVHVTNVIGFMRERADELGLRGIALNPNTAAPRLPYLTSG